MSTTTQLRTQLLGCRQLLFKHLSGSCFNIHVYNASESHNFLYFTLILFIYLHSGMAVVQKCWKYDMPIFQNRIAIGRIKNRNECFSVTDFQRPPACAHEQDLMNLRPRDLVHPYLDSQIFHNSRSQLHILGIRRITWSKVLAQTHISGWTCEPYSYLVLSALCI